MTNAQENNSVGDRVWCSDDDALSWTAGTLTDSSASTRYPRWASGVAYAEGMFAY